MLFSAICCANGRGCFDAVLSVVRCFGAPTARDVYSAFEGGPRTVLPTFRRSTFWFDIQSRVLQLHARGDPENGLSAASSSSFWAAVRQGDPKKAGAKPKIPKKDQPGGKIDAATIENLRPLIRLFNRREFAIREYAPAAGESSLGPMP